MSQFTIALGAKVKDKVTGFTGFVVGRVEYLTGCNQYGIVPQAKGGEASAPGASYFDEGRLTVLKGGIAPASVQTPVRGGPNRDAP